MNMEILNTIKIKRIEEVLNQNRYGRSAEDILRKIKEIVNE